MAFFRFSFLVFLSLFIGEIARRWRVRPAEIARAAIGCLIVAGSIVAAAERPNIVLIVTDDQGYWDTGVSGNPHIDTPHMDRLAGEGVQFTRFYAAPVCAPTRAGLMTGRYYLRTGLYNTRFGGDTMGKGEVTVAELLKESGYRTGLFGKWHLGKYYGYQPNQRGFDEFLGHYHGHIERYEYPDQLVHNSRPVEARGYVSDLFTQAAHVDLLPTICELAGCEVPGDRVIDGKSLVPLLKAGKGEKHHEFVYHTWDRYAPNPDRRWAVSDQRYKLLGQFGEDGEPSRSGWKLFDLEGDPGEDVNLAQKHPEKVEALRAEFLRWFEEVTEGVLYAPAPVPVGNAEENPVELQPSWAKWHGEKIEYHFQGYDWDTIEGWSEPGERAEWALEVVESGAYEVSIAYGCRFSDAGGRLILRCGGSLLEYETEATPTAETFREATLGVLELHEGAAELVAEAGEIPGKELMRLNRIWLKKID